MFDPAQLAALAAVHRRGSFDLAAAELHVTPSAVSQRIKALEDQAGTLLIRRASPCSATPAGLRMIRHHDEVVLLERALAADLPWLSPAPATLRIAVNADSLATWVLPALAEVEGFLFDLVIDDQEVSQDWLKRGEVQAAITSHPRPPQGCVSLPLGTMRYLATASPAYLARWFPEGVSAESVAKASAMTFNSKDRLQARWVEGVIGRRVPFPTHWIASSQSFVDGALLGLGWGMNPEILIEGHLAAGRLVELVPGTPMDVPLYWQASRIAPLGAVTTTLKRQATRVLRRGINLPNPAFSG